MTGVLIRIVDEEIDKHTHRPHEDREDGHLQAQERGLIKKHLANTFILALYPPEL